MSDRIAYSLRSAAEVVDLSPQFLQRAIKSLGRPGEVPQLRAKKLGGRAGYRISRADLLKWFDSLPDA